MSGAAQMQFLQRGGPMAGIMDHKREKGELDDTYVYREYPKMIRVSLGLKTETKTTDQIRGREVITREWEETREHFREVIVNSEAEEEAVLGGGRSEDEIETQRQEMIGLARSRNIQVDPTWGLVRLQRELGAAPTNETIDALRTKVADLEEKAALRAQIAALEARIAHSNAPGPGAIDNERDMMRQQLAELGVAVDMRWQIARLRSELDAATAPG